jgi:hypothetical protein
LTHVFCVQVADLVRIVTVLAPHHKHLETLRAFVAERLPPGFPVRYRTHSWAAANTMLSRLFVRVLGFLSSFWGFAIRDSSRPLFSTDFVEVFFACF